jgi:hypothetical protein
MRFLADENFNGDILHGLLQANPDLDILRVQDTEMYRTPDPQLLEWAAQENRILITHDKKTIPGHAFERVAAGLFMPGVIEIKRDEPLSELIAGLLFLMEAGLPEDFENQVRYVPMR